MPQDVIQLVQVTVEKAAKTIVSMSCVMLSSISNCLITYFTLENSSSMGCNLDCMVVDSEQELQHPLWQFVHQVHGELNSYQEQQH